MTNLKEIKTATKKVAVKKEIKASDITSLDQVVKTATQGLQALCSLQVCPSTEGLDKIQALQAELEFYKGLESFRQESALDLISSLLVDSKLENSSLWATFVHKQADSLGLSLKKKRSENFRPNGVLNSIGVALGDSDDSSASHGLHWNLIKISLKKFAEGGYKTATFTSSVLAELDLKADPLEIKSARNAFCNIITCRYGVVIAKGKFQYFDLHGLSAEKTERLESFLKEINWDFYKFPLKI